MAIIMVQCLSPALAQTSGIITTEVLVQRLGGYGAADLNIQFGVNSDKVTPRVKDQMRELGQALTSNALQAGIFEIIGHTDASGRAQTNKELSQKRAESVRQFLIRNFGVAPARLKAIGLGEVQLRDKRRPDHASNRRMEIRRLNVKPSASP
ncbi:MAG: OmpA family protein [Pseudomonadota bacterium]|nr:OmpA family protein [Pseudomonadota bacterium]